MTRYDKRTLAHCGLFTSRNGEVANFPVFRCGFHRDVGVMESGFNRPAGWL